MSRYRFDRDDDFYYGGRGERGRGYEDERFDAPPRRVREGRGGGAPEYFYDDERTREGRGYGGGGAGGGRQNEERDIYGGSSRYGGDVYGSRGYDDERTQVRRPRRRYEEADDDDRDEGRGRSVLDEGRDYVRRAFGGRGSGGPSRSHVRCRDIMTRDVTVATRETTLDLVARMMRDEDTGVIPVVEPGETTSDSVTEVHHVPARTQSNGRLVGLITDRDIVIRALAEGREARQTRAEEVMTTELHTVRPNDRVIEAIRRMGDKQVRRLPVVDREGNLRGIISMADIALETEADRELGEALE